MRKARKPRQVMTKAAEKAKARTYPRPMCGEGVKPIYVNPRVQHVPTKEPLYSSTWSVQEKPKDVQRRNSIKLVKDTRKRYTDFKISVLQVLNARRHTSNRNSICIRCTGGILGPNHNEIERRWIASIL